MQYNTCKSCGACDGRAGMLIDDNCLNCHYTLMSANAVVIRTDLVRTPEELARTMSLKGTK